MLVYISTAGRQCPPEICRRVVSRKEKGNHHPTSQKMVTETSEDRQRGTQRTPERPKGRIAVILAKGTGGGGPKQSYAR